MLLSPITGENRGKGCVHTYRGLTKSCLPFLWYVCTWQITAKPIYVRSCYSFHSHKAPHPPSGRVGDVVAMLQIEFLGIGNHGIAEAAGFQRCKGIFFAPYPVSNLDGCLYGMTYHYDPLSAHSVRRLALRRWLP